MANKIQIKRSTTNAAPTGLANGELAYTANGEILFLGHPDGTTGSIAIGGLRNPGTLTANQALVANSSSAINEVRAGQVNAITTSAVGANVVANTSALLIGNSSVNSILTSTQLSIGANVFANSSAVDVGNTIIASALLTLGGQVNANGGVGTAGQILTSGAAGNVYWGAAPSGVTDLTDSADATTVTILSSTGTDAVLESANATAAGILTSADWTKLNGITAGATTYDLLAVANTEANKGIIRLDGANSSVANDDVLIVGANGVVVSSNSSTILITGQLDTDTTYDILTVANTTTNEGLVRLDPSNGANDDIKFIGQGSITVSSNTTAVYISGTDTNTTYDLITVSNTTVGVIRLDPSSADANDDVRFIGANGIIVTSDGVGNLTISTDSAGTGTFNNLTVSGNLEVNGTLSTFNVNNVVVEDSMIALASNNTADTLDIGFYGKFGASATYSGLFRDASATDKSYKLFTGAIPEPGTTVDTANVNFAYSNLTIHSLLGGAAGSTIDLFTIDGGTF